MATAEETPNATPVAYAGPNQSGIQGERFRFDGSGSSDQDGVISAYVWDFGDGNEATGISVNHVFANTGSYVVTLTVTDDRGAQSSDALRVVNTTSVTLATLSAEIFTPNCAVSFCHAGPNASNGMSLEAGVIASEIIGVTSTGYGDILRIAPGDPDNSLIVQKVRGEAGTQMPQGGTALSEEAIARLIEWIEAGAIP